MMHRLAAAAALLSTAAACDGGPHQGGEPDGAVCPLPGQGTIGTWELVAGISEPRCEAQMVWTGEEVLIRGGPTGIDICAATDEAYDPATRTTRVLSSVGRPPCAREGEKAVWTGSELIVWGILEDDTPVAGRYDPATDQWRAVSLDGAPTATYDHTAVWTGSEMIVFGGRVHGTASEPTIVEASGAYDPASDTWRAIATEGAPSRRFAHTAVWTGEEMLIWSGRAQGAETFTDGAAYDPVADAWRPMSSEGSPKVLWISMVWTGTHAVVFGQPVGAYDPAADAWVSICAPEDLNSVLGTPLWTGDRLAIVGGRPESFRWDLGGVYDPATRIWTPITIDGASTAYGNKAVWTGSKAIVFADCALIYELTL